MSGRTKKTAGFGFGDKATGRPRASVKHLEPGVIVTDVLGHAYRPMLDEDGKAVVRRTRPGDLFLAQSKHDRVVRCDGPHLRGLLRQIMEEVA